MTAETFLASLPKPYRDTLIGAFTWSNNGRAFLKFKTPTTGEMSFITRKADAALLTTDVPEFATLRVWL